MFQFAGKFVSKLDINSNFDADIHSLFPQYAFEVLFRSQQYALMDNGCREYIFLSEFFMVHDADAMKLFMTVMGKTLQHVQVSSYVLAHGHLIT